VCAHSLICCVWYSSTPQLRSEIEEST
jgi:hypothetical protein